MAPIVCRFCQSELSRVQIETSRNWYCRHCAHWDARECLKCRTPEGFPLKQPWISEPEAKLAVSEEPATVLLKSYVYCELDFHNAFFVERDHATRTSKCRLCETTWDSRGPAQHREGVGR